MTHNLHARLSYSTPECLGRYNRCMYILHAGHVYSNNNTLCIKLFTRIDLIVTPQHVVIVYKLTRAVVHGRVGTLVKKKNQKKNRSVICDKPSTRDDDNRYHFSHAFNRPIIYITIILILS